MRSLRRDKRERIFSLGLQCLNRNACQKVSKTRQKVSFAFSLYCSSFFLVVAFKNAILAVCPAMQRMLKLYFTLS
jgi:hypothetical protein